jgi:hypothetical protein
MHADQLSQLASNPVSLRGAFVDFFTHNKAHSGHGSVYDRRPCGRLSRKAIKYEKLIAAKPTTG